MSGDWWVILIPGTFLAVTLVCITDIGNYIRKENAVFRQQKQDRYFQKCVAVR